MLDTISIFLNFLMIVTEDVIYPGECSMCTWEKSVFCCFRKGILFLNEYFKNYPLIFFKKHILLLIFLKSRGLLGNVKGTSNLCLSSNFHLKLLFRVVNYRLFGVYSLPVFLKCIGRRHIQLLSVPLVGSCKWKHFHNCNALLLKR